MFYTVEDYRYFSVGPHPLVFKSTGKHYRTHIQLALILAYIHYTNTLITLFHSKLSDVSFLFTGIFYLQSRNTVKNVETKRNTDVRIYFHDFLVYLCQHSLQQRACYLTVSPAILQQLCHTLCFLHETWREVL